MQPSQQSTAAGAHSGLGMALYAQVTSPLRRYLDLVIHQQLRAFLLGKNILDQAAITERIGVVASVQRDLRRTERYSRQHWTLVYLLQHPEWQGEGVIVEQHGRRHVVILPELDLDTEHYLPDNYRLDDRILLQVQEVNLPFLKTRFASATSRQSP
jgi:exoribonuclease-2